jgi:hypothetical protein
MYVFFKIYLSKLSYCAAVLHAVTVNRYKTSVLTQEMPTTLESDGSGRCIRFAISIIYK